MTNDEAITNLNIIREAVEDYVCNYLTDTAKAQKILNALQDMEQHPSDTVSRGAVREILAKYHLGESRIAEKLNELPPATQKYGKWIDYNYSGHECVYCSNCKTEYYEDDLYLGGSEFPKYCPNCGCRMIEPQESEVQE